MTTIENKLAPLMSVNGAMAAALVDYNSGMMLGSSGTGLDLEIAAAGNTEVVRAKIKTIEMLQLDQQIEDILITLTNQYHLIRPMDTDRGLFIYYVLDSGKANLALARRALQTLEETITL
ncbi:hypothetical protein [Oceanobacter antarcticus]|uniref:Roadblock/LC7 domain-containing protein n=1 Tax=Oceanobacter antarcticus TaxID=3133425 RepID=A0ABW8NP32_9GAMM